MANLKDTLVTGSLRTTGTIYGANEVLTGKLTLGAAPTANMDAATKEYVDQKNPFHLTMELSTSGSDWTQQTDPDSGETYYEHVITNSNYPACDSNDLIFVSPNPSVMDSYKNYLEIGARAIGQNPNETDYISLVFHANSLPDSSILGLIVNVSVFPG